MLALYLVFAMLGTLSNLGTQELVVRSAPAAPLTLSIGIGTIVGFLLKYALDKLWVFRDGYGGHRDELVKVTLYGAFSIVTTLIFWAFELSFWEIWRSDLAKYGGAVLGLGIGYITKFMLDRTFVFQMRRS